jgi:hypothetical protein
VFSPEQRVPATLRVAEQRLGSAKLKQQKATRRLQRVSAFWLLLFCIFRIVQG